MSAGLYSRAVNWFSATKAGSFTVKHLAAKVDPWIYERTNGRFTITGKATVPQLTLFAVGRKSGEPRPVQLAYHQKGDDLFVVASAMGQQRHPAWRYNLEAHREVEVQLPGRRLAMIATLLAPEEKSAMWADIADTIPQMHVYVERTDRDICVFRLSPA
ncbi:MAG TPA: nitroreductase/quinone reductase family protein [Acidimicrobiales bacterium]|nr:nitroreductase/quinone reductase family protein [Acidimicrobiales bacterium]